MTDIYGKLEDIFADIFDEEVALTAETTARDIEGWDSLAHIRLMLSIERAFKIKFSTLEINNLKNVGELVALIEKHQAT